MKDSVCRKIILSLLDGDPKSAQEISENTGEPLETIEAQLTRLVSENICEADRDDKVVKWTVRKDIETFAQLVQEFISSDVPSEDEKSQFLTSQRYVSRIDLELVGHVVRRFHVDSAYRSVEEKSGLQRILLASPSALAFALNCTTAVVDEMYSKPSRLNPSHLTIDRFNQQLRSDLETGFLAMLIADFRDQIYASLHAKLNVKAARISMQVGLASPHETFLDTSTETSYSIYRTNDVMRSGTFAMPVNPLSLSEYALAFVQLGESQTALENLDVALPQVQNPIEKAVLWNNKGYAFFTAKQYQKAIECFEAGLELDSEGRIPLLREHKQVAEEYLARATDADNLTQPTQVPFVQGQPIPFEETIFYEFKEVKGENPVRPIVKAAEEYAVAFLNHKGGRIFWGIRNDDKITIGVMCDERRRDEIRRKISEKLGAIDPPVSIDRWQLEFHSIRSFQGQPNEDLWVVELLIQPASERNVFYTSSGELFVKTVGGRQKLRGSQVTEFIRKHFENNTETD